jgi:hypothetical protein
MLRENNKKIKRPTLSPEVRSTLDFFVARGIINYSSWDECYFQLTPEGGFVILDYALDEWFKKKNTANM